jgi:hypothetical protein
MADRDHAAFDHGQHCGHFTTESRSGSPMAVTLNRTATEGKSAAKPLVERDRFHGRSGLEVGEDRIQQLQRGRDPTTPPGESTPKLTRLSQFAEASLHPEAKQA